MDERARAEELARRRFIVLNIVRLMGVALVFLGLAVHFGRVDLPAPAGFILVILGFFEFFFLPNLLSRNWRTPDR
jgi:hypothetical protein